MGNVFLDDDAGGSSSKQKQLNGVQEVDDGISMLSENMTEDKNDIDYTEPVRTEDKNCDAVDNDEHQQDETQEDNLERSGIVAALVGKYEGRSVDNDANEQEGTGASDEEIFCDAVDIDDHQQDETQEDDLESGIAHDSAGKCTSSLVDDDDASEQEDNNDDVEGMNETTRKNSSVPTSTINGPVTSCGASTPAVLSAEAGDGTPVGDVENQNGASHQKIESNTDDERARENDSTIEEERPISDIEQAIDSLVESCEKGSSDDDASSVHDFSSQSYYSCSSTMANHSSSTMRKKETPLNETAVMDSSSDEESASIVVEPPAARRHRLGGKLAGQIATTTTSNHRRTVMAAGVVSVALIVLVGLGLGLSRKGNDNEAASDVANSVVVEPSAFPSRDPSNEPSFEPSNDPSNTPSMTPSVIASSSPSTKPSSFPSMTPSIRASRSPSLFPSWAPSSYPTPVPTSSPSMSIVPTIAPTTIAPTISPTKLFLPGDLAITNTALDIRMSSGLSVKSIATTGKQTKYANGMESSQGFHGMMDGAGIVPLADGGYVYVSNSEIGSGDGGVYGLYFDKDGDVIDYKTLLSDTTRNCGGGLSPWNTWISCEETGGGQCWQVDPDPQGANHGNPRETLLGGDGGRYETVACDNRRPDRPIFFTTEDHEFGALRKFVAEGNGWDALHNGGSTTFLRILDESTFEWTSNESAASISAATYYRNAEGVIYHEGLLYFTAKKTRTLFILNLEKMTYESEKTGLQFSGKGSFNAQPDQIVLGNYKRWIYFTEDGGTTPGVYVRDLDGTYYTIFEAIEGSVYSGDDSNSSDETVGIALSPDRRKLYAGFQDAGVLMEFTRDDGFPFE